MDSFQTLPSLPCETHVTGWLQCHTGITLTNPQQTHSTI
jgi:hypothetical protein